MIYLQMSHVEQIITQILSLNKYILSLKREHFFIITLTLTTLQRLNNQDDVYWQLIQEVNIVYSIFGAITSASIMGKNLRKYYHLLFCLHKFNPIQ